jgi:chromosomal replication initiation ATPase DnaA
MSRLSPVPQRVLAAVAEFYDDAPAMLAKPHDPHIARAVAAWLCRRDTDSTLSELGDPIGSVFPEPIVSRIQRGACKSN